MKLTNQKNTAEDFFLERCQKNQSVFSSFIDLIPSKIYLNPEDHSSWTKYALSDSKKKKTSKSANEAAETKKGLKTENGHKAEIFMSEGEESDMEFDDEINRINKFDPRIFKTVSQIFNDFQQMEDREKKNTKFQLNAKKSVPNNTEKSTSIKLFNKSQHKSLTKQENDAKPESAATPKKPVKRVSKQKEQKNIAAKRQRQRYDSHTEPQIVEINHSEANSIQNRKQVLNRNGQVVFSKFDFTADKSLKAKPSKANEKTLRENPKDYKQLIKKLQDKREHIDKLKITEPEKANELEINDKWKTAIDKASGVKVKDDIALLKKTVKKIEKKKDRSKKKWQERVKDVESIKAKSQDKRNKNIEKRKEKVKETKLKKLKKKGRIMPGF